MEIYVMRHGIAEERGEAWPDDEMRPLTSEGRAKAREVARGLAAIECGEFDRILTSPLVRAVETAEVVARELRLDDKVRQTSNLAPAGPREELYKELSHEPPGARVLLVGHEPDLGDLIGALLTGGGGLPIPLKKASVCRVDLAAPPPALGQLRWLLTAGQLRALGKKG